MTLTIYNKVSIIDLVFFVPALAIALLLTSRHGFRRSAGWVYAVLLSLMRIVGASMQLATIQHPNNISIAIGAQTLQSVGLSPPLLILLGLLARAHSAIPETSRPRLPSSRSLRLTQIVVLVGLILLIVGGIDIGNQISDAIDKGEALSYQIPALNKAGIALLIVGFAVVVLSAAAITPFINSAPKGEKRVLAAIYAAAPFVLVRLVYSATACFDASNDDFRQYGGSAHAGYYVLGMCTVMEIVFIVIVEAVGLTLPYSSRSSCRSTSRGSGQPLNAYPYASGEPQSFPKERESV